MKHSINSLKFGIWRQNSSLVDTSTDFEWLEIAISIRFILSLICNCHQSWPMIRNLSREVLSTEFFNLFSLPLIQKADDQSNFALSSFFCELPHVEILLFSFAKPTFLVELITFNRIWFGWEISKILRVNCI